MSTSIFVSIPTDNLERSKAFYEGLGWNINPTFSNDQGVCIVVEETVYLMVMERALLASFTDKTIIDPRTQAQVSLSFTRDSRADVDAVVAKGLAAGGS